MKKKNILFKKENAVGLITINRPDQLNALNNETIEELHQQFVEIRNDKNIKVIIITGEGDKAFVAGADIKEFANFSKEQGKKLAKNGQDKLFNLIENFSKPVIAAINGFALGGGLELAMACHIRIASENAKMGLPEVSLGVIPGYGGTQRLAQLIGKGKALELITTAQMINSNEALKYGLINHLVTQENLIQKCLEISKHIIKNSPNAISAAIKSINAGYSKDLNGYNEEIESLSKSMIIFLSARGEDFTQIAAFDAGADDYINKPVKPKILLKKISSISRRILSENNNTSNIIVGSLVIDRESYSVTLEKDEIALPRKEFELLYLLASKPGKVLTRDEIMFKVWGTQVVVGDRTIDVHVRKLREKIGEKYIKTIKGVGYKFKA